MIESSPSKYPSTLTSTVAIALVLWIIALRGVAATYSTTALVVFGGLYLLLALAATLGARWLAGRGGRERWLAGLGIALLGLWQLREVTAFPQRLALVAAIAVLLAFPLHPLLGRLGRESRGWLDIAGAGGALVVLALGSLAVYRGGTDLRWHLLRHNTLLGTPVYYLADPGVEARREALFARHGAAGQTALTTPPPAEAVTPNEALEAGAATVRPNLVFILLDTLRGDALSDWGGRREQMPRLEARLESAHRFTDLWSAATWTRPAMASFFTGLQPEAHGAREIVDALAEEHTTLAESLRSKGYQTTAIVTNWAAVGAEVGFDQGFDQFHELRANPYARAETVGRATASWLANGIEDSDRPKFLYLHFLDPHEPYLAGVVPRQQNARELWRAYDRELAYLDEELDQILERLEAELSGPTLFLLASDHGEEFYEHELFGHGFSLYEEVLSVPFAIWGEGISPLRDGRQLEGRDLYDLILSLADGGASHLDAWTQARQRSERYASIYYSSEGRLLLRPYIAQVAMRAVQVGDEKLIWSAYGDTWELYDLADDREETHNLASSQPQRIEELARTLEDAVVSWRPGTPLIPSEEALEQLQALGYIDR